MTADLPTDRIPYQPIVGRPPLPLPDGARVVVWPCLNIEHWPADQKMPRTVVDPPANIPNPIPDVPNWSWHEYGQRVGFWRLRRIFTEYGIRPTVMLGGSVCDAYPQIVDACVESGWDFAGHGWIQRALPAVEDPRKAIFRTFERIHRHTGKPPRGWLGPALAETAETADWLREAGFEYVGDWILDDQPVDISTQHGPWSRCRTPRSTTTSRCSSSRGIARRSTRSSARVSRSVSTGVGRGDSSAVLHDAHVHHGSPPSRPPPEADPRRVGGTR